MGKVEVKETKAQDQTEVMRKSLYECWRKRLEHRDFVYALYPPPSPL